jgi:hypothetical protein
MHRILPSAVRHGGLTKILGEAKQLASPPLKLWILLAVCLRNIILLATLQIYNFNGAIRYYSPNLNPVIDGLYQNFPTAQNIPGQPPAF